VVIQLTKLYRSVIMLLAALALLTIMAVAEPGNYTVDISSSKFLGNFLVNQSGYTLYYFQNDSQLVGDSACYGECADLWHPFYVARLILPESLRRGFWRDNPCGRIETDHVQGLAIVPLRQGYYAW
jgi:hypothetical protein